MTAAAIFIVGLMGLVPALFATAYAIRRIHKCKCKKYVWAKVTDCSPCGPNPLNVYAAMIEYHCKACGEVYKSAL
jgi:hypothetical protein